MEIEELTVRENYLEESTPNGGYFEERDNYLKDNKVYEENKSIFSAYVSLAEKGNTEAIKRALFYLWYQCSEPNQLSGNLDLEENEIEKVLFIVNNMAKCHELDLELKFMLPYYYQICEWYFDRFGNLEALLKASNENEELWQVEAPKILYANRGKMGEYWESKSV